MLPARANNWLRTHADPTPDLGLDDREIAMICWAASGVTTFQINWPTFSLLSAVSWQTSNRPVTGFPRTIPTPGNFRISASKCAAT
nr:hypothetical protein [uncultured bacterium]